MKRRNNCAGEEKWRARGFVVAALALSLIRISLLVKISYNQRNLETALAEKDRGAFILTSIVSYSLNHVEGLSPE